MYDELLKCFWVLEKSGDALTAPNRSAIMPTDLRQLSKTIPLSFIHADVSSHLIVNGGALGVRVF